MWILSRPRFCWSLTLKLLSARLNLTLAKDQVTIPGRRHLHHPPGLVFSRRQPWAHEQHDGRAPQALRRSHRKPGSPGPQLRRRFSLPRSPGRSVLGHRALPAELGQLVQGQIVAHLHHRHGAAQSRPGDQTERFRPISVDSDQVSQTENKIWTEFNRHFLRKARDRSFPPFSLLARGSSLLWTSSVLALLYVTQKLGISFLNF